MCIENNWVFYLIYNENYTYAGVSNKYERRLRQHNGEIKGGAKYTTSKSPNWKHICLVEGFHDKIQAMQFEWAVKHVQPRNVGGVIERIKKLYKVLLKEKWTSKSPLASEIELIIHWKIEKPIHIDLPKYVKEINYSSIPNSVKISPSKMGSKTDPSGNP